MKYDLEDRLIEFACKAVQLSQFLPNDTVGNYLRNQLIRSSLAGALNYAEALSAESRKDFIHKNKVVLKELRESFVSQKIIHRLALVNRTKELDEILTETNELISIFHVSVNTALKNMNKMKK